MRDPSMRPKLKPLVPKQPKRVKKSKAKLERIRCHDGGLASVLRAKRKMLQSEAPRVRHRPRLIPRHPHITRFEHLVDEIQQTLNCHRIVALVKAAHQFPDEFQSYHLAQLEDHSTGELR